MREVVSKLQQQFLILENKVFLAANVVFSLEHRNIEGKSSHNKGLTTLSSHLRET